jgi:hypothetical protein
MHATARSEALISLVQGGRVMRGVRLLLNLMEPRTENLTARFLATTQVNVSWIYEDVEGFLYKNVDGSVVANSGAQSEKFKLREKNGDDVSFEVIIRKVKETFVFVTDHPEMKRKNYPLKVYVAPDELIFYFEDAYNRSYFHLS